VIYNKIGKYCIYWNYGFVISSLVLAGVFLPIFLIFKIEIGILKLLLSLFSILVGMPLVAYIIIKNKKQESENE